MMSTNRALQTLFALAVVAATATPAAAQTIYPITRAEILAGAKFDFKVEFPGSVPAADIKITINGRDPERESRGIVGNMDAAEAAELALDVGASRLVPYHWDGFRGNTVPPGTVVDAAAGRLHVVVPARFETFGL